MSDIPYINQAQEVKITGQSSGGSTVNYVTADANGNLAVKTYSEGPVTPGTVANASALIGGQFNTSLPTLTTTQQSAIQIDSSARIIISPLTNASIVKAQLQDNSGTAIVLGQSAMASSLPVVLASNQTGINTFLDKTGSGTIVALNGAIVATTNGCSIVSFNVTGTWVATIVIEATLDGGSNWIAIDGDIDATDTIINSFTSNSLVTVNCSSYNQVRLRSSLFTSGTVSATWSANLGLSLVEVFNTNAASLKISLFDGSANAITSTTINSKQRLDINTASEGIDGAASPFQTIQVGGKDPSGNLQTLNTDSSGNILTSEKIPLTPSSPGTATVGVTSASALASNANRKGLIIQNLSANTISLNVVGGAAVLNSGITLFPGGTWNMDSFSFTVSAIFAIASAASSVISIQEFS